MKRTLSRYRKTIRRLRKELRECKCRELYLRRCENPPIIYHEGFVPDLEFAAVACGQTPTGLRKAIEENINTRRDEARIPHPSQVAHGLCPDIFDLNLGLGCVHFSYEPKAIVVRGMSWPVTDESDDGGRYMSEPRVDDVFTPNTLETSRTLHPSKNQVPVMSAGERIDKLVDEFAQVTSTLILPPATNGVDLRNHLVPGGPAAEIDDGLFHECVVNLDLRFLNNHADCVGGDNQPFLLFWTYCGRKLVRCLSWTESAQLRDAVDALEQERTRSSVRRSPREAPVNDPCVFGGCPVCGGNDGFLNYGRGHWFYCKTHRLTWCIGENWFGNWRLETQEDWDRNACFLRTCGVVEPVFPDSEPITLDPQEAK